MAMVKRVCTCGSATGTLHDDDSNRSSQRIPESVELFWSLTSDRNDNGRPLLNILQQNSINNDTQTTTTTALNKRPNELLVHNFEKYGWSPICIRWWNDDMDLELSTTTTKSKTIHISPRAYDLLYKYQNWKQIHADLFHDIDATTLSSNTTGSNDDSVNRDGTLRYVPFESGASGTSVAEAKVSWEYHREHTLPSSKLETIIPATISADITNTNMTERYSEVKYCLQAWTEILHIVISHVMKELDLPNECLMVNYCNDDTGNIQELKVSSQPLDLLRAFRYDPSSVEASTMKGTTDDSKVSLGSSPHTDWGSWTVVWQDDTYPPCLQTFCYHCQKWNSVMNPPPSLNRTRETNVANFIVHVGDITSLCIRHATIQNHIPSTLSSSLEKITTVSDPLTKTPDITNLWPSPRHRVVSPTHNNQCRHSLVYFIYPPDTQTPTSITKSLEDWCRRRHYLYDCEDHIIPTTCTMVYEDYSLLCDQSACATTTTTDSTTTTTTTTTAITTNCNSAEATTSRNIISNQQIRWNDLQEIPVRKILEDKWKQVQR